MPTCSTDSKCAMIISKTVLTLLNPNNYTQYLQKGYEIPTYVDSKGRLKAYKRGSTLLVSVQDLSKQSNCKVEAECEICLQRRTVAFSQYSPICWKCNLDRQKGKNHPRFHRYIDCDSSVRTFDLYLRRTYNMTSDTYYTTLEKQRFSCPLCSRSMSNEGRRFAVDHCHVSGKVRGILCQPCNTALGLLKENIDTLSKAIAYLRKKE